MGAGLKSFFRSIACLEHVPWSMQILWNLRFLTKDVNKLNDFCKEAAEKRYKMGPTNKDVFHHLVRLIHY